MIRNALLKLIGWKALILHGDLTVLDRLQWVSKHLSKGNARTLDAGCGNGVFSIYAAKTGNETIGISFDEAKNTMAKLRASMLKVSNVQFIKHDLRKLNEAAKRLGKFDQIMCLETLEHIKDDRKLISDLCNLLKPKGKLILTVPHKKNKGLYELGTSKKEDGGHVRYGYSFSELEDIFNECGLNIKDKTYISGVISQKITSLMFFLNGIFGHTISWIITFPCRILQILDYQVTKLIKYPHLSIGVVGLKINDKQSR